MLIIDRFESDFAVCENGDENILIPRSLLPSDACEGDVLIAQGGAYAVDEAAVKARREAAKRRLAALRSFREQ